MNIESKKEYWICNKDYFHIYRYSPNMNRICISHNKSGDICHGKLYKYKSQKEEKWHNDAVKSEFENIKKVC